MQLLEAKKTPLTEYEAAYALREAWKKLYSSYPANNQLALLWAQSCLECGRWKSMHLYNFGNLKPGKNYPDYYQMFRCSEILNGKEVFFDPPHEQTWFRAYKTMVDGAIDYIEFVSKRPRYLKAWEALKTGDPAKFSHELKVAGYYTASEKKYTDALVKLTSEFLKKADKYIIYKIEEPIELEKVLNVEERKALQSIDTSVDLFSLEYERNFSNDHDNPTIVKRSLLDSVKKFFKF